MLRRSERTAYEPPVAGHAAAAPEATSAMPVTGAPVTSPSVVREPTLLPVAPRFGGGWTMVTVGILTVLVGAWAGIVPFVGPLFGFHGTGTGAWTWTLAHALLWLVPGAVAVLMGFLMASQAPGISAGVVRSAPWLIGVVTVLCGAWLVIGPVAWPVLEHGMLPFAGASRFHEALYWIGYSLGPGVILAMLGGSAMGIAMLNRRATVSTEVPVVGAHSATVAA